MSAAEEIKDTLFAIYADCAERSAPVPSRLELCETLGRCISTVIAASRLLEQEGRIIVPRNTGGGIRVKIVGSGQWTKSNHSSNRSGPEHNSKPRLCLCGCGQTFQPQWRGNFIKPACKDRQRSFA